MKHSGFFLLLAFSACFISASAQDSATLKGVITDPNGAVVAGAKVTAVNALTREESAQ